MRIEHIAMYVSNLEESKRFFETYFGASAGEPYHNRTTNFRSYFLTFENGIRLELMNRPEMEDVEKSEKRTGFHHLAFCAGSRKKVNELTEKLRSAGFPVISGPRVTGDGYYESCVEDPEGNLIEIIA